MYFTVVLLYYSKMTGVVFLCFVFHPVQKFCQSFFIFGSVFTLVGVILILLFCIYTPPPKKKKSHNGGAYFIGKSLWAKGYDRLINLLEYSHDRLGRSFHLDVYGSGPDREEIEQRATDKGCDLTFFPATDHALLGKYSVFVNPSVSERDSLVIFLPPPPPGDDG